MSHDALRRTPLYNVHVKLGAKMVSFGGWEMPLQYPDGILKEHEANRKGCSVFDCSHMGEFLIEGDAKASGLDEIVTQSIAGQPVGTCRYGMALNSGAVRSMTLSFIVLAMKSGWSS